MTILIPSRSRWDKVSTLKRWPAEAVPHTRLVVRRDQADQYRPLSERTGIALAISDEEDLGLKRRRAVEECTTGKVFMLDDDLVFLMRRSPDAWQLRNCEPADIYDMLCAVSEALNTWSHVCVSSREGQHRLPYPRVINGRPMRALGYNRAEYLRCAHGRVKGIEDFDIALQLMRRGLPNCILTAYAQGQGATQAAGGCADWRTAALHDQQQRVLAELHAPYVKLVARPPDDLGPLGCTYRMVIAWAKAAGVQKARPEPAAPTAGLFDEQEGGVS